MNSGVEQAILTVGGSWALSTLAKASLIAAVGLGAAAFLGGRRAAVRHAVLAAALGALLALPLASALAPRIGIAVGHAQAAGTVRPMAARTGTTIAAAVTSSGASSGWSMADWLTAAWVAGMVVFLLPAAAGLWAVRRLRRAGTEWPQGLAADRGVEVLLHDDLAGPMTCGVVRPAIVLPADAPDWNAEDLERALVHELAHVARHDWAIHCAARAVCALYWFHPLVWMTLRRLELEAERACDDAVLERSEATAYADQLVAVARKLSAGRSPMLAMANRKDLESRVKAVLDGRQRRGRAGRWCVTLAAAMSVALLIAVSPLQIVAAPQTAEGKPRLRVDTRLVVTEVKVLYPNDKTVEGLSAGDFEVTEDGVPHPVAICEFRDGVYLVGYYSGPSKADGQFRKLNVAVKTVTVAKVEHRAGFTVLQNVGFAQSVVKSDGLGEYRVRLLRLFGQPPVVIFKKEPEYTEEARKAKYQGTVLLDVAIDDTGKPRNIQVVRSLGLGLDEKAIEAVRQWRFRPAMKDGQPVRAQTEVEVIFRLL